MVNKLAKKLLRESIIHFAETEGVKAPQINLVIHTKDEDLQPKYFYTVDGAPKRDEDNNVIDLNFKKDILRVLIDGLSKQYLLETFIKFRIPIFSELFECPPNDLYFMIVPLDDKAEDIVINLNNKSEFLKNYTLKEIFEME